MWEAVWCAAWLVTSSWTQMRLDYWRYKLSTCQIAVAIRLIFSLVLQKKKTKILHMANFIQLNCKSRYFRSFSEHYLVALSTGIPTLADFPLFFWHRNQAIGMGPYFLLSPRTVCAFPSACLTGWMSRNSNGSDSFAHILHILRLHWEEMMPFCTICFTRNYVKDRVKNGKAAAG